MKNKQLAVIGLGRFGMNLTKELSRMNYDVLAMDNDEDKINEIAEIATHAFQADAMDEKALQSVGIRNFDIVVVSIAENIQVNILTTILLKEMGVKKVVAKARNNLHGKVLEKIGADVIIYPERDMAVKLARSLVSKNILEHIDLSPTHSIVEVLSPKIFWGSTLMELDVRRKLGITALAIKRNQEIIVAPRASQEILEGDILVIIGKNTDLDHISEMES